MIKIASGNAAFAGKNEKRRNFEMLLYSIKILI